jgi:hypothetical protein
LTRFGDEQDEWIGVDEASRALGVAPATLRRWSDRGDVPTFITPGGHRRYRRSSLERFLRTPPPAVPLLPAELNTSSMVRAYRSETRRARDELPWLDRLTAEQRDWFRQHGRRLAGALLNHLDAGTVDRQRAETALSQATDEAAEYGRMASVLDLSLGQTVEGFLRLRRPFLQQLGIAAGRREMSSTTTTELIAAAEAAMDRLLLAVVGTHKAGARGTS